jgi:hypothetical protein
MLMNLGEIVIVVMCLTALGLVLIVLMGIASHRRPPINSSLQECPDCGAHNRNAREHCYCCGFAFILPQSDATEANVIQRVKQADDSKMRRSVETQAVEDTGAINKEPL